MIGRSSMRCGTSTQPRPFDSGDSTGPSPGPIPGDALWVSRVGSMELGVITNIFLSLEEIHLVVTLQYSEQSAHIRMLQHDHGLNLSINPIHIRNVSGWDHLDGNLLATLEILAQLDDSHRTLAQDAAELVLIENDLSVRREMSRVLLDN